MADISEHAEIRPFTIAVPDEQLKLLERKLELTTLPDDPYSTAYDGPDDKAAYDAAVGEEANFHSGAPLPFIRHLVNHWKTKYSWRDAEAKLNKDLQQFTTEIEVQGHGTIDVHFVHHKGSGPEPIPLLFVHGWPGSFLEVSRVIGLLTDIHTPASGPSFSVVAPSLPGYGFSSAPKRRGFGLAQMAETCHKLMLRLGYDKYVTQGGDWGALITRVMALLYSQSCLANHVTLALPDIPVKAPQLIAPFMFQYATGTLSEHDDASIKRSRWYEKDGSGYYQVHATKPQTIGYAQTDSPVGLLAWISEKLYEWTDPREWKLDSKQEFQGVWSEDDILTWVCIYAFSRAGPTAAMRLYYETNHDAGPHHTEKVVHRDRQTHETLKRVRGYIRKTKLGVSRFPHEIIQFPMDWNQTLGPLVFERVHDRGGHFASWEVPDLLVGDVREMMMLPKVWPC